jgi:hypothetical protein
MKYCAKAAIAGFLASLVFMPSAWPWGPIGHRVAAKMAQDNLTTAALTAVHDLLGPETSLVDIATWADEQTEVPDAATWHYINIPITESSYSGKYCQPQGCVVSKINEFRRTLQSSKATKTEKQRALKFLVHFIADLHQPLHVGDTGSRGGNQIQVLFYGQGSNLHKVWDSQIMEHYSKNERVWLWQLTGKASPENKEQWSGGTTEDWATESLQAAKKAYSLPGQETVMRSGSKLGDEYVVRAIPIIEAQLAKAGIRIAWILNEIFQKEESPEN